LRDLYCGRRVVATYPSAEQVAEMRRLVTQARTEHWLGEDCGSWRWWVLLVLLIAPWFVWYKLADNKKLPELVMFGLIVMVFMLTYQYFPTWKRFFWALVAVSAVFSFIVEPIIVYLGFYVILKWLYWYSFIIYIVMGLLSRWLVVTIFQMARKG